jgi:hypothetical protein
LQAYRNIRKPDCGSRKYYVRPHEITSQMNVRYKNRKTTSVPHIYLYIYIYLFEMAVRSAE